MSEHPLVLDQLASRLEELTDTVENLTKVCEAISKSTIRMHRKQIELETIMTREGVGGSSIILPN